MSDDNKNEFQILPDRCTECEECFTFGTKSTGTLVCVKGNHYKILDDIKPCKDFKFRWPG